MTKSTISWTLSSYEEWTYNCVLVFDKYMFFQILSCWNMYLTMFTLETIRMLRHVLLKILPWWRHEVARGTFVCYFCFTFNFWMLKNDFLTFEYGFNRSLTCSIASSIISLFFSLSRLLSSISLLFASSIRGCSSMMSVYFGPFWTPTPPPVSKNQYFRNSPSTPSLTSYLNKECDRNHDKL